MNDFKGFIYEYRGAIIGGIIAIVVLSTGFLKVVLGALILGIRSILRKLYTKQ